MDRFGPHERYLVDATLVGLVMAGAPIGLLWEERAAFDIGETRDGASVVAFTGADGGCSDVVWGIATRRWASELCHALSRRWRDIRGPQEGPPFSRTSHRREVL